MSAIPEDKLEIINMEKFFEQQIEDWRAKMIKVYGDQYPYAFYVTSGHDFEDLILKHEDSDAPERKNRKSDPFENLKEMYEIDKMAEKEFHKILSDMAKEKPTPDLKQMLDDKKIECAKVFEMFDQVVAVCENYFEQEYNDCHDRVSKQMMLQKPVINEVEKFLAEVEAVGNAEVKSLRDRISKWIYDKGLLMLENVDKSHSALSEQPFAMTVWFDCSSSLTSKNIRSAFLADQKELTHKWKKAFDDLLMLSTKLEKCRCNYNLIRFKLEREIFWLNRDYKENMPELTKIQRHLSSLIDQKAALKLEMRNLENEVKSEQKRLADVQYKMHGKIQNTKMNNKFAHEFALKKFKNVLKIKKEEVYTFLVDILKGDQFIHEEILDVVWIPTDISHLKPEDDKEADLRDRELDNSGTAVGVQHRAANSDSDENFSTAFQLLVTCENFITLLNIIADELGYVLDLAWIDYIKNKLKLSHDIKWLELFKVFKINFVEDIKELKDHMMSYCKVDSNGEVVFDINGALDGFLNFVWLKRQPSGLKVKSEEYDPQDSKDFWIAAADAIPKSLLWESVEEILFHYWELLEARANSLKKKFYLTEENKEFENLLQNYHKYGSFSI